MPVSIITAVHVMSLDGMKSRVLSQPWNSNPSAISNEQILALIMPYNSLGSPVVFDCLEQNIPIIAVKENKTCLDETSQKLGINDIILKDTYDDCINILRKL